jgi:hypothetical protein
MGTGDIDDIFNRLKKYIPYGWFTNPTVNLDAILKGLATAYTDIYDLIEFTQSQTRIATATGIFLDLIAQDYLGFFPRRAGENDATYRHRIQINILRERVTRPAIVSVLEDLTGRTPIIYEGWRPQDTNWLNGGFILNQSCYGSRSFPGQFFVKAFRPVQNGSALNGLNNPSYALNGNIFLGNGKNRLIITDRDILQAVQDTKAAGIIAWVNISD